jgi:hypothetical protein
MTAPTLPRGPDSFEQKHVGPVPSAALEDSHALDSSYRPE